jgi:hypothetical protein
MVILRRILLLVSTLLVLSQRCLGVYFAAKAPQVPDHAQDAIYPVRIHQSVVYITRAESYYYNDRVLDLSFYLGAPVIIVEILAQIKRSKKRQEDTPPPG